MDIIAIAIVLVAIVVSAFLLALYRSSSIVKFSRIRREVKIHLSFECDEKAAEKSFHKLEKWFVANQDKFILKKLELSGYWKDCVSIECKASDGLVEEIELYRAIGDILNNA